MAIERQYIVRCDICKELYIEEYLGIISFRRKKDVVPFMKKREWVCGEKGKVICPECQRDPDRKNKKAMNFDED